MIENLPENFLPLAPLLICVIGAFLPCRRTYPISTVVAPPHVTCPTNLRMKVRVKTLVLDTGTTTIMTNDIRIKCRECEKHFKRLEWMSNKECDNPNCRCPEVKRVREQANEVITKASESSRVNIINIKRNAITPTGYDDTTNQYMIDVPDVMVIDMIVPKQFKGRRK